MNAQTLLDELRRRGAVVQIVGDRLRVEGPRGAVSNLHRRALAEHKREIQNLLDRTKSGQPAQGAPDPCPPELWRGGLKMDEETAEVFSRFAEHGTQPAWDDLIGAAQLERQVEWSQQTLDAVYRGCMTLSFDRDGRLSAHPRGAVC